jgi:hypothetical protein
MIDAFGHLADRIKDAGDLLDVCVIGWDSMNEPSNGFIGLPNLEIIAEEQTFRYVYMTCPSFLFRRSRANLDPISRYSQERTDTIAATDSPDGYGTSGEPRALRLWHGELHLPLRHIACFQLALMQNVRDRVVDRLQAERPRLRRPKRPDLLARSLDGTSRRVSVGMEARRGMAARNLSLGVKRGVSRSLPCPSNL